MCQGFGVISQSSCASSKLTWHLRDSSKTRDQRLARSLVSTMELFEYLFSFSDGCISGATALLCLKKGARINTLLLGLMAKVE